MLLFGFLIVLPLASAEFYSYGSAGLVNNNASYQTYMQAYYDKSFRDYVGENKPFVLAYRYGVDSISEWNINNPLLQIRDVNVSCIHRKDIRNAEGMPINTTDILVQYRYNASQTPTGLQYIFFAMQGTDYVWCLSHTNYMNSSSAIRDPAVYVDYAFRSPSHECVSCTISEWRDASNQKVRYDAINGYNQRIQSYTTGFVAMNFEFWFITWWILKILLVVAVMSGVIFGVYALYYFVKGLIA